MVHGQVRERRGQGGKAISALVTNKPQRRRLTEQRFQSSNHEKVNRMDEGRDDEEENHLE